MGLSRADMTAIAARTGYPVKAAWIDGHGPMGAVAGVIMHHTATPGRVAGDIPTLKVLREGRPGLDGPLCNYGLGRSGTVYLITNERGHHAGVGSWKGITAGSTRFLGIEAEHPGDGSPWPAVQVDAYARLVASILRWIGKDTNWNIRHADWAEPAGRKVDTRGIDMPEFDARVRRMLSGAVPLRKGATVVVKPRPPAPKPAPTPPPPAAKPPAPTPGGSMATPLTTTDARTVLNAGYKELIDEDGSGEREGKPFSTFVTETHRNVVLLDREVGDLSARIDANHAAVAGALEALGRRQDAIVEAIGTLGQLVADALEGRVDAPPPGPST